MAARGRLVVLEGAEGAGKTTLARRLAAHVDAAGVPHLAVREPGGTAVGNEVRRIVLDEPHGDVTPRAEALLFMASRAQLVEREIRPAIAAGKLVLADRFFLSTYAYQIHGRGLEPDLVREANRLATGGLVPDLTVLLRVPTAVGMTRIGARGPADRIEQADPGFHTRVAEAFDQFATPAWQRAHPECGPITVVDAAPGPDAVFAAVLDLLARHWPDAFAARAGSR
ncbi:MAG TPA: dTMP kinase [Gemmatimonadaceae bacterium]|nr:dTMP kinase [Gemmatimonadaceae bacterium]